MGRKRSIQTATDLQSAIDDFVKQCEQTGDRPSDYTFAKFLGIRPADVARFYADGEEYPGFADAMKDLIAYREDRLCAIMEKDPKKATAAIMQLKQPHSGGYTDSQSRDGNALKVIIETKGVGGPEAFK